ncbi:MAG: hypothetical protein QNK37_06345 [Acidobacteriota bacterium]|nr:hypothetical protein [Acidobacteriota bacterium]
MIEAVGNSSALLQAQAQLQTRSGGASPVSEPASAFDIALQIQDVQAKNFRRTLDAQTQLLDLLA